MAAERLANTLAIHRYAVPRLLPGLTGRPHQGLDFPGTDEPWLAGRGRPGGPSGVLPQPSACIAPDTPLS